MTGSSDLPCHKAECLVYIGTSRFCGSMTRLPGDRRTSSPRVMLYVADACPITLPIKEDVQSSRKDQKNSMYGQCQALTNHNCSGPPRKPSRKEGEAK